MAWEKRGAEKNQTSSESPNGVDAKKTRLKWNENTENADH